MQKMQWKCSQVSKQLKTHFTTEEWRAENKKCVDRLMRTIALSHAL